MNKHNYTSLETSKKLQEAMSFESDMWWKPDGGWNLSKNGGKYAKPALTLHEAMQWIREYGEKYGWITNVCDYDREEESDGVGDCVYCSQHRLLDAFLAGNERMDSDEVTEFFNSLLK